MTDSNLDRAVRGFLAAHRVAVAGFSRRKQSPANAVYHRLAAAGHEVFAVNPAASVIEGRTCHPDLKSIPGGVDAVFIATGWFGIAGNSGSGRSGSIVPSAAEAALRRPRASVESEAFRSSTAPAR